MSITQLILSHRRVSLCVRDDPGSYVSALPTALLSGLPHNFDDELQAWSSVKIVRNDKTLELLCKNIKI